MTRKQFILSWLAAIPFMGRAFKPPEATLHVNGRNYTLSSFKRYGLNNKLTMNGKVYYTNLDIRKL